MTIATLLLLVPMFVQTQWTVDDSGGADFTSIAAAIPAVSAGDVLLVEPGNYGAFTLDKRLSIIGATGGPRPMVSGESLVSGGASVTLAGLDLFELMVASIPGRATLTDCEIGHTTVGGSGTPFTFRIQDGGQVLVSNSTLLGNVGDEFTYVESPGARVESSVVSFTDCVIHGGDGADVGTTGAPGQPGVEAIGGSFVIVAGCVVTGGDGGTGIELCSSSGGSAIRALDSTIYVRGTLGDSCDGGNNCPSGDSYTISGSNSDVTASGVTLDPPWSSPGIDFFFTFNPEEPYIDITGSTAPGGVRTLHVYADAGDQVLVFVSLAPAIPTVPKVMNGPLWFDPASVLTQFAVTGLGQDFAVSVPFTTPMDATLAGLVTVFQGFMKFPAMDKYLGTNPADVTLRF